MIKSDDIYECPNEKEATTSKKLIADTIKCFLESIAKKVYLDQGVDPDLCWKRIKCSGVEKNTMKRHKEACSIVKNSQGVLTNRWGVCVGAWEKCQNGHHHFEDNQKMLDYSKLVYKVKDMWYDGNGSVRMVTEELEESWKKLEDYVWYHEEADGSWTEIWVLAKGALEPGKYSTEDINEMREDPSPDFTKTQMDAAINGLKNGKAAGRDRIFAEIFKELPENAVNALRVILSAAKRLGPFGVVLFRERGGPFSFLFFLQFSILVGKVD